MQYFDVFMLFKMLSTKITFAINPKSEYKNVSAPNTGKVARTIITSAINNPLEIFTSENFLIGTILLQRSN